MKDVDSETELKDAFRMLDNNGLGYIGVSEMQKICKVLAIGPTCVVAPRFIPRAYCHISSSRPRPSVLRG